MAERRSMLLAPITCDQINEHVFKHYNYNGLEAQEDLDLIARADITRRRMRKSVPLWLGMTAISGYNVTRMGVLSNSGRIGAIGGLVFGSLATLQCMTI